MTVLNNNDDELDEEDGSDDVKDGETEEDVITVAESDVETVEHVKSEAYVEQECDVGDEDNGI